MKIDFPKIFGKIDLGEYAPEMAGQKISVWVNPPSADVVALAEFYKANLDKSAIPERHEALIKAFEGIEEPTDKQKTDYLNTLAFLDERIKELEGEKYADAYGEYLGLLSGLLSQNGNKDAHFSPDDLRDLQKASEETDPAFWTWLQTRVFDAISEHRLGVKKA